MNENTEPIDVKIEFAAMNDYGLLFYPDAIYRMSKEECLKLAEQMFKAFVPSLPKDARVLNDEEVRLKFFELIRDNNALRDKLRELEKN